MSKIIDNSNCYQIPFEDTELKCADCGCIFVESSELDGSYYCPECNGEDIEPTGDWP